MGTTVEGVGGTGSNNVSPQAVADLSLMQSVTTKFHITSATDSDPSQLCISSTDTGTACNMTPQWESWLTNDNQGGADAAAHDWMMKGIAKCALPSGFVISNHDGSKQYPGQWGLFESWEEGSLGGQIAHEWMSACILTLLNGNNESLHLCIIGPGGSPFSDACDDSTITVREGGFYGDLFAANPTAYIVGPQDAPPDINGRDCYATNGTYCCEESDTSCTQHIILTGGMTGSDSRCNIFQTTGSNGQYQYCASFWTNREPGRNYTHGFTTFIPAN